MKNGENNIVFKNEEDEKFKSGNELKKIDKIEQYIYLIH